MMLANERPRAVSSPISDDFTVRVLRNRQDASAYIETRRDCEFDSEFEPHLQTDSRAPSIPRLRFELRSTINGSHRRTIESRNGNPTPTRYGSLPG